MRAIKSCVQLDMLKEDELYEDHYEQNHNDILPANEIQEIFGGHL